MCRHSQNVCLSSPFPFTSSILAVISVSIVSATTYLELTPRHWAGKRPGKRPSPEDDGFSHPLMKLLAANNPWFGWMSGMYDGILYGRKRKSMGVAALGLYPGHLTASPYVDRRLSARYKRCFEGRRYSPGSQSNFRFPEDPVSLVVSRSAAEQFNRFIHGKLKAWSTFARPHSSESFAGDSKQLAAAISDGAVHP